jgi:hypothetical protein
MVRCKGIKRDGSPCTVTVNPPDAYCWWHDPSNAEQRRKAASRGGARAGRGRPLTQLNNIKEKILEVTEKVEKGDILRGDAAVMFQGYNTYISAVRAELKATEQLELVSRFEQLEEALTDNPNRYHHYGR